VVSVICIKDRQENGCDFLRIFTNTALDILSKSAKIMVEK